MRTDGSILHYAPLSDSRGGAAGVCERLPSAAAIYAWFRTLRIPTNRGAEAFVEAIVTAIEAPAASEWRAKLGPMHSATLESRSELTPSKLTKLETLARDESFRAYAARMVEASAVLQSPLYVGKAHDLQRRIRQHLDPMSELSMRLRDAGIRIEDCTIAYAMTEEVSTAVGAWTNDPQALLLIEEVITRICRPGFVARPG